MISDTELTADWCFPAIRAITATNACASAVANNARAIPCGRRRATMAPMIPMASTPTYIRSAGSPSAPMRPDGTDHPYEDECRRERSTDGESVC